MKIHIINGPNLNMLGKREPDVYGDLDFESYFHSIEQEFTGCELSSFQSNIEGEIISDLQKMGSIADGIILNAGAYTHTSIGIGDAISGIETPVIEVHISNIYGREDYRHHSFLSGKCLGLITGLGLDVYRLAVLHFMNSNP